MSRLADFLRSTKDKLAIAAGFVCTHPACRTPTFAVDPVTDTIVCIGIAAHDVAASPKGPRANADMTIDEKRAITNGAWLCRNCAELVDRLPMYYPTGTISGWQRKAQNDLFYRVTRLAKEPDIDA